MPAQAAPRPWALTGPPQDPHLRLGRRVVRLADIADIRTETSSDRHGGGLMASFSLFLVAGCVCIVGVVEAGWRPRFLLAAVACLLLGGTSLLHFRHKRGTLLYRLVLTLRSGEMVCWSTAEQETMADLRAALTTAGNRSRAGPLAGRPFGGVSWRRHRR